uniref:Cysteine protease ATG4B n=1 Tax=Pelusios castaneus TaxID=367368 RepID=A0A8C8VMA8_9SAUR
QDAQHVSTLTYDTLRFEYEDFPETKEPVWILGRQYSVFTEKEEILLDVTSRLWFTYRRNFPAIGPCVDSSLSRWCSHQHSFRWLYYGSGRVT